MAGSDIVSVCPRSTAGSSKMFYLSLIHIYPNLFAREYYEQGIDELLYIDIVASLYNRNNLSDIVRKTVDDVYIPVLSLIHI